MTNPGRSLTLVTLATALGLALAPRADAATLDVCGTCTHTTLASALAAAVPNGVADTIRIVQGTHPAGNFSGTPNVAPTASETITIEGGYDDATFTTRTVDPTNTILDGQGATSMLWVNTGSLPLASTIDLTLDGLGFTNHGVGGVPAVFLEDTPQGFMTLIVSDCRFTGVGTAISTNTGTASITVLDTTIESNAGTAIVFPSPGGDLTVRRAILRDNPNGGISITPQNGHANAMLENVIVADNGPPGAGVVFSPGSLVAGSGTFTILNSTITGNATTGQGGGLTVGRQTLVTVTNSIIRDNSAASGGQDIHIDHCAACGLPVSTVTASFSDVGDVGTTASGTYLDAGGNFDLDPLFNHPPSGDYRLTALSPCIDAGTNTGAPAEDFEGEARPLDGDGDLSADTDVGADELDPNDPPPAPTPTPTVTLSPTPTLTQTPTPTKTATPTETATPRETCTPPPTPVGPTPTPGDVKGGLKCQRAIAKEASKFVKARAKALQKCHDLIRARKITPDPGLGGGQRLAFCLGSEPKTMAKLDKASSKIGAKIAKACGGANKLCGDFDPGEETPAALGFAATCPTFEGNCGQPVNHCGDVASCLECIAEDAVDQAMLLYYDAMINYGTQFSDLLKCGRTVGKEATKFLLAKEKILQKCWDKRLKGVHADLCPDAGAPAGSLALKSAEKIAKGQSKIINKICKACGLPDTACEVGVPPVPGNGVPDAINAANFGFPPVCPAVTVPGGPAPGPTPAFCGDPNVSLEDLIRCVDCVTEFKVECVDRAARPQHTDYPCECR